MLLLSQLPCLYLYSLQCCFHVFHSAEYTPFYLLPEIKYADATITIDKVRDDNEFLLLNSRYTHALFGKKDNCIPFLDKVLNVSEEENKSFVEDYISLFKKLRENIQLAYDQRGIPNFYIRPCLLNIDNNLKFDLSIA